MLYCEFGFFLVMMLVLHLLVFRPFLRARDERADKTSGERSRAQEMLADAERKMADFLSRVEKAPYRGQRRSRFAPEGARPLPSWTCRLKRFRRTSR